MKRALPILLASTTFAAALSQSKPAPQQGGAVPSPSAAKQFLETLDENKDGRISRREWKGAGATFLALDTDLDGYLSLAELMHAGSPAPGHEAQRKPPPADEVDVAIPDLRDPPELFKKTCNACHDSMRILAARKDAKGWAATVERMRKKPEAKFTEKEAKLLVEYLNGLRKPVAQAAVVYGSNDPRRDWGLVLDGPDLHQYDRDKNGRLDGGELARLAFERLAFDRARGLTPGELSLLPLAVDRRALFQKLDRDHDGFVSLKELGALTALLDVADANKDGQLTKDEFPKLRAGPIPLLLAADAKTALALLDQNHDGRLSYRELERFPGILQQFDSNKDGELDAKELETAVTAARAELPYVGFDDFLARYDLDGDGQVSRLEFPGSDAVFARLDTDGDGVISAKDAPGSWKKVEFTTEAVRWR